MKVNDRLKRGPAALSPTAFGGWFEDRVQAALEELMKKEPFIYQRLYDTKSAGSMLPKQPADFMGCGFGRGFLIEAKGTTKYTSLGETGALKALVKSHQSLGAYLMQRAGGLGMFVFYSRHSERLEIWNGGTAAREAYVTPRAKLSLYQPLFLETQIPCDASLLLHGALVKGIEHALRSTK